MLRDTWIIAYKKVLIMDAEKIPVYAIIELLIRVSNFHADVGNYLSHTMQSEWIVIRTSKGMISFSKVLIVAQLKHPENITDQDLLFALSSFEPISSPS